MIRTFTLTLVLTVLFFSSSTLNFAFWTLINRNGLFKMDNEGSLTYSSKVKY